MKWEKALEGGRRASKRRAQVGDDEGSRDGGASLHRIFIPKGNGEGQRMGNSREGTSRGASFLKGLILAQNERWRRGLGMQVERVRFAGPVAQG